MHKLNPVRARKIEAIRWRLPALSRLEAVWPAGGPRGEEVTIIVVVPANGDDGIQPLYFPYAVPIVMEAIAREAGWLLAWGKNFISSSLNYAWRIVKLSIGLSRSCCT